jgi:hypothetical protein
MNLQDDISFANRQDSSSGSSRALYTAEITQMESLESKPNFSGENEVVVDTLNFLGWPGAAHLTIGSWLPLKKSRSTDRPVVPLGHAYLVATAALSIAKHRNHTAHHIDIWVDNYVAQPWKSVVGTRPGPGLLPYCISPPN